MRNHQNFPSKTKGAWLIPVTGIILSLFALTVRAVWTDTVNTSTSISSADWNQMAVVLTEIEGRIAQMEDFLPGQVCGLYLESSGTTGSINCNGFNPNSSCPTNFRRIGGVVGNDGREVNVCVKNP